MDEKDEFRRFSSRYKTEKIKSRNLSEKKRRDQFNMLINELCSMVTSSSRKMDKSSVLRATISFLRNHNELSVQSQSVKVQENWKPSFLTNEEFTHLMLEALDGFIIVFSCNGQILYTSESTASLLGYLPSRIYSSVFDIIHEVDKSSLYKLISNAPSTSNNSLSKDSFVKILLHMKRGPIHSQGSNSYELVQLLGTFYHWPSSYEGPNPASFDCDSNSCSSICSMPTGGVEMRSCFVAVGRLQTPHLLRVVNLSDDAKNEFTSRHSLEWKFLFLDHRAPPIIGYLPFEVLGTSGYDYYHVEDLDKISSSHELLMQTGEGTSCFYRFLTKGQQWIWLQTRYYISYHQWNSKPEFIVCTHTVVSTEKVLKSLQETPKKMFSKNSSPLSLPHTSATPSQSACLSPSPSASSLGSLSSEHSEHCSTKASSTSTRVNSVLYSHKQRREMNSPVSRASHPVHPMLPDNFMEPPNPITNLHQNSHPMSEMSAAISSSDPTTMPSHERSDMSSQLSSESVPLVPHSPSLMMNNEDHVSQFQNERLAPPMNQAHLQEYLRRRHQMLQQQIRLQQEELRRVSEQLMLVQFVNPPPPTHSDISYQVSGVSTMPGYVNNYSVVQPGPSMPRPMSEECVMIKNLDSYTTAQSSPSTSRTYMNLEPSMCGASTNAMPHISVEQNNEALAQSYSMNHQMPSNS